MFYNKLNKLLNKHAPFKPISKRKKKRLLKPWVTKGIRKSIKIKNDLYCSGDTTAYKLYRNKVLMKQTKNKVHKDIISLKCPSSNLVSQNPSEFPDIMNKYFSSIGHNLASKMPNSPKQFTDYLPKLDFASSFFFNPVSPSEIDSEIMTIQLNKAQRLYSFHGKKTLIY